jgi:hypothetical protein
LRQKSKCYEVNCANEPLKKVGINMLRQLGIQPGTESFEKQKHLIVVNLCKDHFMEKFPTYMTFKKAFFQGILMISKTQYMQLAKTLYGASVGKIDEGAFQGLPRE